MLWKRAPLPPPVYLTPGLLPSAFSSTAESSLSAPPVATALVDEWHSPFCIPRLYSWYEGNPGHTVQSAHASTRMQLVRSSIPLLHGTLLGVCVSGGGQSLRSTGVIAHHYIWHRQAEKNQQIIRPQEAERIGDKKIKTTNSINLKIS